MQPLSQMVRWVIAVPATALYVAFAAWSYTAALGGDMITAAATLFLAWLVSVCALGLSEAVGAFKTIPKLDLNFGFALFMAIFNGALFAYFYQHRPSPPYVEGARLIVVADQPIRTDNGNYYFPVTIHDVGDRPVDAYADGFFQKSFPAPLDINGETAFMALSEAIVDQRAEGSDFSGTGSDLTTKTGKMLTNRQVEITPAQIEAMRSGAFYLYEGVTVVFSDENSKRTMSFIMLRAACFMINAAKHFSNAIVT
jgi:hypothetical protein